MGIGPSGEPKKLGVSFPNVRVYMPGQVKLLMEEAFYSVNLL